MNQPRFTPIFVRVFLRRLVLLMLAYTLSRVVFLAWNYSLLFRDDSVADLGRAFVHGLRFDVAVIFMTNAAGLLLLMLPARAFSMKILTALDLALFTVVNVVCLGLNFIDTEFVKFIGKRSSVELLRMTGDIRQQGLSILASYWYLGLATAALTAALVYVIPRVRPEPREGWIAGAFWRVVAIAGTVIAIRGGVQFKPVHPMDAYFNTHRELGLLTLNTPFNLIKSPPRLRIHHERYFAEDREAADHLKAMVDLSRPPLGVTKGWNVVVLVMESFATEYVGAANAYAGFTPFFDSLTRAPGARFFKRNFANARRSLEGVPAVYCGLPAMMEEPILTSDFSNNHFDCLPRVLGRAGYETYFLHGAHNGSMHLDTFSNIAGFKHFVGLDEFPKDHPEDLDQAWGVLDEPMLQYAIDVIDHAPKPVMLGVFTLSAHHPYFIPPNLRGKFPKGTLEIHESIGYADYALKRFFETARTKPWYDRTIFVITADHTQKSDHPEYTANEIGFYRVPLLVYAPGLGEKVPVASPERITQQIDILPSVLDLLGVTQDDRLLVGQSVFDRGREGRAYNYSYWSYWYIDPKIFFDWGRPPHPARAFAHDHTWSLREVAAAGPAVDAAALNLRAVVHYMNEGLSKNSLHEWRH